MTPRQANWAQFMASQPQAMTGHLMPYPIRVLDSGLVTHRALSETVPDAPDAPLLGSINANSNLPFSLTT